MNGASLMAQLVKNPPAMQETWVQSLDWEDPLGEGKVTHSSILAWRSPWSPKESAQLSDFHFHFQTLVGKVFGFSFLANGKPLKEF